MGLLTNLLTSWGGQFKRGETGAKEEVEVLTLQEKLAALKRAAILGEKPAWSTLPPGMEHEAAGGLLPGQRREEMVGPTYGELGALGKIAKDFPISQLITAKAGPEMMKPWLSKIMPPKAVEETAGGVMFPTKGLRGLEQYLGVAGEIEKAKGILPEQRKGLTDIAETLFGITEKRKRPAGYTLSPGQQRFVGREKIAKVDPKAKEERAQTDFRFFVDEYRKEFPEAGIGEVLEKWKAKEVKDKANKGLLSNYTRSINQTLKKYGIESGISIKTLPDGTWSFSTGNKESVYQALEKKAAEGHIRAAEDLEKINYWYEEIDKLMGVPEEITGKVEEERQLDAIDPLRIR